MTCWRPTSPSAPRSNSVLDEVIDQLVPADSTAVSPNRVDDAEVTTPVGTQVTEAPQQQIDSRNIDRRGFRSSTTERFGTSVGDRCQRSTCDPGRTRQRCDHRRACGPPGPSAGALGAERHDSAPGDKEFAEEPLRFVRRIELSGDQTHRIVGAVLAPSPGRSRSRRIPGCGSTDMASPTASRTRGRAAITSIGRTRALRVSSISLKQSPTAADAVRSRDSPRRAAGET